MAGLLPDCYRTTLCRFLGRHLRRHRAEGARRQTASSRRSHDRGEPRPSLSRYRSRAAARRDCGAGRENRSARCPTPSRQRHRVERLAVGAGAHIGAVVKTYAKAQQHLSLSGAVLPQDGGGKAWDGHRSAVAGLCSPGGNAAPGRHSGFSDRQGGGGKIDRAQRKPQTSPRRKPHELREENCRMVWRPAGSSEQSCDGVDADNLCLAGTPCRQSLAKRSHRMPGDQLGSSNARCKAAWSVLRSRPSVDLANPPLPRCRPS